MGKNNEPLYLCDCNFENQDKNEDAVALDDIAGFGFTQEASKGVENNLSLDNEVRDLSLCGVLASCWDRHLLLTSAYRSSFASS